MVICNLLDQSKIVGCCDFLLFPCNNLSRPWLCIYSLTKILESSVEIQHNNLITLEWQTEPNIWICDKNSFSRTKCLILWCLIYEGKEKSKKESKNKKQKWKKEERRKGDPFSFSSYGRVRERERGPLYIKKLYIYIFFF